MLNGSVATKGNPRVVDRRGRGIVPLGIETFADVAEPNSAELPRRLVVPNLEVACVPS